MGLGHRCTCTPPRFKFCLGVLFPRPGEGVCALRGQILFTFQCVLAHRHSSGLCQRPNPQTHLDEAVGGHIHGVWVVGTSLCPPWTTCIALENLLSLLASVSAVCRTFRALQHRSACIASPKTRRRSLRLTARGFRGAVSCIGLRAAHPSPRALLVGLRAHWP